MASSTNVRNRCAVAKRDPRFFTCELRSWRPVLLGAVALGGLMAPPALAQGATEEGATEQAALDGIAALVERHLPNAAAELAGAAAKRREPVKVGRAARLFDAAVAAPLHFAKPLAAFAGEVAALDGSWADSLDALVRRVWVEQYAGVHRCPRPDGAGATHLRGGIARPERLAVPRSLAEAARQIRTLAGNVVETQRHAMSGRTRRLAARDAAAVAELLRDTFTGAMRRGQRRMLRRFVAQLEEADFPTALCAASTWTSLTDTRWLRALGRLLAAHPQADAAVIRRESTPWGEIVFGGRGDGVIRSRKLLFLADLDGHDYYGIEGAVDFAGHPQFVVDFGGDDRYEATSPGGYAGGVGRTAIVVDMAGDDVYRCDSQCQGHGLFGVGALIDLAGTDSYVARHHAQGAGLFGIGFLWDGDGDDAYTVEALGQGLGLTQGVGTLSDVRGDDAYSALGGAPTNYGTPGLADAWAQGMARGLRGLAPGGLGVLADGAGNDSYDAGSFAQGGAYYLGVGQLVDYGAGADVLFGSRYNAGWGAHGGVGRFFNAAGDDRYATRHIVAAGLAWDYSLALFQDASGDDAYRLPGFSLGAAAHGSVAVFIDAEGSDDYHGKMAAEAGPGEPNLAIHFDGDSAGDRVDGAPAALRPRCGLVGRHALSLHASKGEPPDCSDLDGKRASTGNLAEERR